MFEYERCTKATLSLLESVIPSIPLVNKVEHVSSHVPSKGIPRKRMLEVSSMIRRMRVNTSMYPNSLLTSSSLSRCVRMDPTQTVTMRTRPGPDKAEGSMLERESHELRDTHNQLSLAFSVWSFTIHDFFNSIT